MCSALDMFSIIEVSSLSVESIELNFHLSEVFQGSLPKNE